MSTYNTFFEALKKQDPFFLGFPSKVKADSYLYRRVGGVSKRAWCQVMHMEVPLAMYVPDRLTDSNIINDGRAFIDTMYMIFHNGDVLQIYAGEFLRCGELLKNNFRQEVFDNEFQ